MMNRVLVGVCAATFLSCASSSLAQEPGSPTEFGPVQMGTLPLYFGAAAPSDRIPIMVHLENAGPMAKGDLQSSDGRVDTPFSLGPGERRTILFFAPLTTPPQTGINAGDLRATVVMRAESNGANGKVIESRGYSPNTLTKGTCNVLYIGDSSSKVRYLQYDPHSAKKSPVFNSQNIDECQIDWMRSRFAPDRPLAYKGFQSILLGNGTNSLSKPAIDAIGGYLIKGGTIGVDRGTFETLASNADWRAVVGDSFRSSTVGLGHVVALPFDLESDAKVLNGRRTDLLRRLFDHQQQVDPYPLSSSSGTDPGLTIVPSKANPFTSTLPSFASMVAVVVGYFIAVIPLNLLILRKLRRPELMWITAPVLAIGFATITLKSNQTFASSGACAATDGTLVYQAGLDNGIFEGESQLFFPRTSTNNLGFHDVDDVIDTAQTTALGDQTPETPYTIRDDGTENIPNLRVSNVSFTKFQFVQTLHCPNWFTFKKGTPQDGLQPYTVTNHSPYRLDDVAFCAGRIVNRRSELAPGGSLTVYTLVTSGGSKVPASRSAKTPNQNNDAGQTQHVGALIRDQNRLALEATFSPVAVGPSLGSRSTSLGHDSTGSVCTNLHEPRSMKPITEPSKHKNRISVPVNIEVVRFKGRFLKPTASPAVNNALLATVILCYVVILGICIQIRSDLNPLAVMVLQTLLLMVVGPAAAYPAIAGEKDRRSWDLLQTAPVSKATIVYSKFNAVAALLTGLAVSFLPMVLITVLFFTGQEHFTLLTFIASEFLSLSTGLAFSAFTVYRSAKSRSANAALTSAVGTLVSIYVIVPMLIQALVQSAATALMFWHPIVLLMETLLGRSIGMRDYLLKGPIAGVIGGLVYLGITTFYLNRTIRHLERDKSE